jgi:hypothetical protein
VKVVESYSFEEENLIERELCDLFPAEWLRNKARETGLIKRERKIDPVVIFWTLAIGYGTFFQRTLAGLKRNYERASKQILSDSSWYYRFWIAILTLIISRRIYTIIRRRNPEAKIVRFTQLRWSNFFSENASQILNAVLSYLEVSISLLTSFEILLSEALDPHVNRRRFAEEWWA